MSSTGVHHGSSQGEAMREAVRFAGNTPSSREPKTGSRSSGAQKISSLVLPFLEEAARKLRESGRRLEYGVRKFDVTTGEKYSVYFSVVPSNEASAPKAYYILDLSSSVPMLIVTDSLDVGSSVRRREVAEIQLSSADDLTQGVLEKLFQIACRKAE